MSNIDIVILIVFCVLVGLGIAVLYYGPQRAKHKAEALTVEGMLALSAKLREEADRADKEVDSLLDSRQHGIEDDTTALAADRERVAVARARAAAVAQP